MFWVMMLLNILVIALPVHAKAAGKCITLNQSTSYKYNLDGKGAKEKIKYTVKCLDESSEIYEHTYAVKVYVNGKCFYQKTLKTWSESPVRVMITDVNSSDGKLELLILEGDSLSFAWTSNIKHIRYYKYESGKISYVQDIAALFKKGYTSKFNTIHGVSYYDDGKFFILDGKGNLKANVCLQFGAEEFQHLRRTVTLKNGKFTVKTVADSKLVSTDLINYKMIRNLNAYTTAGGKKVAVVLKKGKKVTVTGVYRTGKGKLYYKVKYGEKYGYVSPSTFIKNVQQLGCLHVGGWY